MHACIHTFHSESSRAVGGRAGLRMGGNGGKNDASRGVQQAAY